LGIRGGSVSAATEYFLMSTLQIPLTSRIPTRGPEAKVRFWPGENSWGKNPHGKPLYRVIWSQSRTYRIGGCWGDNGEIEYRWAPYYFGRSEWVLEKWLSPKEYGGTKEEWDRSNINEELAAHGIFVYAMGPYPTEGWYEHCYSFPSDAPPNLQAIVPLLEETKKLTFAQIKAGLGLYHERKKKEWESRVEDGLKDALPAFGFAPTNLGSTKPTGDTAGLTKSHELKKAMRNYTGVPETEAPIDPNSLPRHGVSMGRPKLPPKETT